VQGMHMLSERGAVIADAKTNVAAVAHHHQSTESSIDGHCLVSWYPI